MLAVGDGSVGGGGGGGVIGRTALRITQLVCVFDYSDTTLQRPPPHPPEYPADEATPTKKSIHQEKQICKPL